MPRTKVAINGYGVIGKRVADAVAAQEDRALAGVADVVTDCRLRVAAERGFPITPETVHEAPHAPHAPHAASSGASGRR